jgi:hypothetical protein
MGECKYPNVRTGACANACVNELVARLFDDDYHCTIENARYQNSILMCVFGLSRTTDAMLPVFLLVQFTFGLSV